MQELALVRHDAPPSQEKNKKALSSACRCPLCGRMPSAPSRACYRRTPWWKFGTISHCWTARWHTVQQSNDQAQALAHDCPMIVHEGMRECLLCDWAKKKESFPPMRFPPCVSALAAVRWLAGRSHSFHSGRHLAALLVIVVQVTTHCWRWAGTLIGRCPWAMSPRGSGSTPGCAAPAVQ